MPNHIHLLWEMCEKNGKEMPHASFQKFTAHLFQKKLRDTSSDIIMKYAVVEPERKFRFWQRDPLAVRIYSKKMLEQKLDYIHDNPLKEHWGLVEKPEDYYYSSAAYYEKEDNNFSFVTHYCGRF